MNNTEFSSGKQKMPEVNDHQENPFKSNNEGEVRSGNDNAEGVFENRNRVDSQPTNIQNRPPIPLGNVERPGPNPQEQISTGFGQPQQQGFNQTEPSVPPQGPGQRFNDGAMGGSQGGKRPEQGPPMPAGPPMPVGPMGSAGPMGPGYGPQTPRPVNTGFQASGYGNPKQEPYNMTHNQPYPNNPNGGPQRPNTQQEHPGNWVPNRPDGGNMYNARPESQNPGYGNRPPGQGGAPVPPFNNNNNNNMARPPANLGRPESGYGNAGYGAGNPNTPPPMQSKPTGISGGFPGGPSNQPHGMQGNNMDGYQDEYAAKKKNDKLKWAGLAAAGTALAAAAVGTGIYASKKKHHHSDSDSSDDEGASQHHQGKQEYSNQPYTAGGYENKPQDPGYGGYNNSSNYNNNNQYYGANNMGGYNNQHGNMQNQNNHQQYGGGNNAGCGNSAGPNYSYNPNDIREPNPNRSSVNSPTPHSYPQIYLNNGDNIIKIGSIVALKHNMTGRLLRTDQYNVSKAGSGQSLVYCHRWNPERCDLWQVLPANQDVPVPGSVVNYGTQIRLRHLGTEKQLHSHYRFTCPRSNQNEVTAFGGKLESDENDHWVVERFSDRSTRDRWNAEDVVVFRHYVSGMTLHSHDILYADDVQSVTCFGSGNEENDKWRVIAFDLPRS